MSVEEAGQDGAMGGAIGDEPRWRLSGVTLLKRSVGWTGKDDIGEGEGSAYLEIVMLETSPARAALAGKTALVTGSGQNIGRAIALRFATAGANVIINGSRNRAAIERVAEEVRDLGVEALPIIADVGDPSQVDTMIEQASGRFGSVDIAVSNVSERLHQPLLDISIEDWQRILNTNLSSAFYVARATLPHMKTRGWGRIIHISGRDGFAPKANRAHNVTCKAGTFALAKAIAVEFGPFGITANAVAPGIIETTRDPIHYPNFNIEYEKRRQALPVRRLGRVDEIAETCLFLASDAGGFITGQVIHANGGEFMF